MVVWPSSVAGEALEGCREGSRKELGIASEGSVDAGVEGGDVASNGDGVRGDDGEGGDEDSEGEEGEDAELEGDDEREEVDGGAEGGGGVEDDDEESGGVAVEVMGEEGKLGRSCSPSRADEAS